MHVSGRFTVAVSAMLVMLPMAATSFAAPPHGVAGPTGVCPNAAEVGHCAAWHSTFPGASGAGWTFGPKPLAVTPDGSLALASGSATGSAAGLPAGDGVLVAFDTRSGERRWVADIPMRESGGKAIIQSVIADNRLAFVTGYQFVSGEPPTYFTTAFATDTGSLKWQRWEDPNVSTESSALSSDGSRVYVTGAEERGPAYLTRTAAYDANTGKVAWEQAFAGAPDATGLDVAAAGDRVVVAAISGDRSESDQNWVTIDGARVLTYLGDGPDEGRPVSVSSVLPGNFNLAYLTLSHDGRQAYLADALWSDSKWFTGVPTDPAVLVSDLSGASDPGSQNLVNADGEVLLGAFATDTGTQLWRTTFKDPVPQGGTCLLPLGHPVDLSPDGSTVYLGTAYVDNSDVVVQANVTEFALTAFAASTGAREWSVTADRSNPGTGILINGGPIVSVSPVTGDIAAGLTVNPGYSIQEWDPSGTPLWTESTLTNPRAITGLAYTQDGRLISAGRESSPNAMFVAAHEP